MSNFLITENTIQLIETHDIPQWTIDALHYPKDITKYLNENKEYIEESIKRKIHVS